MFKTILTILIALNLYGDIEIKQNMKALYKDVELSKKQENYIFDNQEIYRKILSQELKKITRRYKILNEKNIVRFTIKPDGKISEVRFLKNSGNISLDRETKRAVSIAAYKFPRPQEETEMRYIIDYNIGNKTIQLDNSTSNRMYNQDIRRGTTRFQHQSEEYVRVFETSDDGFVNLSVNPPYCMNRTSLLHDNGQRVKIVGKYGMYLNEEIPKGKYKLLLKTNTICNVNLQYP